MTTPATPTNPGGPAAAGPAAPATAPSTPPASRPDDRADLEAQNAELRRQLDEATANVTATPSATAPPAPGDRPEPSDAQKAIGTHEVVKRTAHNPYAGEDQTTYGIVVARDSVTVRDDATGETVTRELATIAWLRDVADPIDVAELEPID